MPVETVHGDSSLLLTLPYTGTNIQRLIARRLQDEAECFTVPDRYLDRLLSGLHDNANVLRANFHRYLSDVDRVRPKDDLQPVKGMIGVVPLVNEAGNSIWNKPPTPKEAANWRSTHYAPYHAALAAQIARIRARSGHVVLINCRANAESPADQTNADPADINFATYLGSSCSVDLTSRLVALCKSSNEFKIALNGQAHCGWTTRHYGRPDKGVHSIDMELNQTLYLSTIDGQVRYDEEKCRSFRQLLKEAFAMISKWRPD